MLTAFMFRYGVLKPQVICEDVHDSPKLSTRGDPKITGIIIFLNDLLGFVLLQI
jgi:hypothetical protein